MADAPADWIVQAWRHWHRPWSVTHVGWLDPAHARLAADDTGELALRLHYPAWCDRYALATTLRAFDDTPWWRLFSLAPARFDEAARRVGLALMFAAQPRTRLVRHARDDDDDAQLTRTRWSLERARFVPEAATARLGPPLPVDTAVVPGRTKVDAPMHFAALSLQTCAADFGPDLWARLKLRLDPDRLGDGPRAARDHDADDGTGRAALAALWADAARATMKETHS